MASDLQRRVSWGGSNDYTQALRLCTFRCFVDAPLPYHGLDSPVKAIVPQVVQFRLVSRLPTVCTRSRFRSCFFLRCSRSLVPCMICGMTRLGCNTEHVVVLATNAALSAPQYAGSSAVCPENRWILDGVEVADSVLFNLHKW